MTLRIDDLTKLPLRGAFLEAVAASLETARASGRPLSLLVMDVDHFKLINDTFGHLQGDDVLREVADLLRKNLRGYDIPARYAGDEFVALLPDTSPEGAREVGERICSALRTHLFTLRDRPGAVPVTMSMGAATFPDHGNTAEELFSSADRALYQVKKQGRDGVAVATVGGMDPAPLPLSIERFVGRTQELRSLVQFLEDASHGRPKVLAISGEAGVGKTTLLKQLEPEVRLRAGSLVFGRCQEADVQPPYGPWAEVINHMRRLDRAPQRRWRELSRLVPALPSDDGAGAERGGSKYLLLEEIGEYIRLAAQERPLVIVLDDMQWADSASWDTLEFLLPQLESEKVLICMLIRAEETHGETLNRRRRLSRSESFHEIGLPRLSREELKQWMEAAFHRQDVGRDLLAFLYRHTEGNPLFVVQVLRTLVDEGAIWWTGEEWDWKPVSELRLPVAVNDLISRRLARLSNKSQTVLTTAAVIGREFDVDLAIEAGAGDEDEMLDAVDEGVRASVLTQSGERGGDRYMFTHRLLAEVLRTAANPRRLKKIHERVARAMEEHTPNAVTEIATHFDRAGFPADALRYALVAAEQARKVYANNEATEWLRIAERNATTPAELADVRVRLATIAESVGRYQEAEELCDLAIDWYAGQGARQRELAIRLMRERVRNLLGQPTRQTLDACLVLDQEMHELGAEADAERVQLLRMLSITYERLGDLASAKKVARQGADVADRVGAPYLKAMALNRVGASLLADDPTQAAEYHQRALDIYTQMGDVRGQAETHNNLGIVYTLRGEWALAKQELRSAMQMARTAGAPDLTGVMGLNLGVVYLKSGEHDRARELFGEALALFAAVRSSARELYALYNLAHLDRERGQLEAATELYEITASLAQRVGHSDVEIGAMAGAGLALLAQGRMDAARLAWAASEERIRQRSDWFQGRELVAALGVHVLAADGDLASAAGQFEQACALAEASDFYAAAWLALHCADTLMAYEPAQMRATLERYRERVKAEGYTELDRRYEETLDRTERQVVRS